MKAEAVRQDSILGTVAPINAYGTAIENDGILSFDLDAKKCQIDISDLWIPATLSHPSTERYCDSAVRVSVSIALVELTFARSRTNAPSAQSVQKRIATHRNVLDYLRVRQNVYSLADATPQHLEELAKDLATGGWPQALQLEQRWNAAASTLTPDDCVKAFDFVRTSRDRERVVDGLRMPYWRKALGIGSKAALPVSTRLIIESLQPALVFSNQWRRRKQLPSGGQTENGLANELSRINDLFYITNTRDRLGFLPYLNIRETVHRLVTERDKRTATISLQDTVKLFEGALFWVYDVSPHLTKLLEEARVCLPQIPRKKRGKWLSENAIAKKISALIGWPVRQFSENQSNTKDHITVDGLISCTQGACATLLSLLNARRHVEVCSEELGVQADSLRETMLEGLWELEFYVAKTYRARHTFFVTQTTADVMNCLDQLRCASGLPLDAQKRSAFWANRPTLDGFNEPRHFQYGLDSKRTRSLSTFLEWLYAGDPQPEFKTHVGRRMFALIYMYKYSNPRLRALSQHLRHTSIVATNIYITDVPDIDFLDSINHKLGLIAGEKSKANVNLGQSIWLEMQELADEISKAGSERLSEMVAGILDGKDAVGGFHRLVRYFYRLMCNSVEFSRLPHSNQAQQLTQLLLGRGYKVRPFQHGDCLAPNKPNALHSRCEKDGNKHHELASIGLCQHCPYFNSDSLFQGELKASQQQWNIARNDLTLPILQQKSAEDSYQNVTILLRSFESAT